MSIVGKVIGIVCALIGLVLLWVSPSSTVSCSRDSAGVSCTIDQSMLGILSLNSAQVHHILRAEVSRSPATAVPSRPVTETNQPNDTYQLAFITAEGRVAPRGVDAVSSDSLRQIADQVNDLVGQNSNRDSFDQRHSNTFATVGGCIFLVVGLVMALFAR